MIKKLIGLMFFGIAFGFVEAAVVYYLRNLMGYGQGYPIVNYSTVVNLGIIDFIKTGANLLGSADILKVEIIREISTIMMLGSAAYISAKKLSNRIGAFLIAFALWDTFYYVFLKILTGWPVSLFDTDIYFLVPVTWIGPVITPIIASIVIFIVGVKLFLKPTD